MQQVVAVIGIGNPAMGVQVVGALANYFGERPWKLRLWDCDEEMLDFFSNLAERALMVARNEAELESTVVIEEAAKNATKLLVLLRPEIMSSLGWVERHSSCPILTLGGKTRDWPGLEGWPEVDGTNATAQLLRANRIVNGDEEMEPWLRSCERTPLGAWLES